MRKLNLSPYEIYNIQIIGRVRLNIETINDEPYFEIKNQDLPHSVEVNGNSISFNNKKKIDDKEYFKRTHQAKERKEKNTLSILTDIALDVFDIVRNGEHIAEQHKEDTLIVNLYLNKNNSLNVNGDNVDIIFSSGVELSELDIDCANIHLVGQNYKVHTLSLDSSNLSGQLLFNPENNQIKIDGNNATLDILVSTNFDGKLKIDGNNVKISGNESIISFLSNPKSGILSADLNNARFKII